MWAAAGLEACSQYSEVVLLGIIAHPEETAAFFVATRIANLFAMISTGLHVATMSRSAALYFSDDLHGLQSVLRLVMSINLALIIPLFGLLALFGADILSLFGHQYRGAYDVVLVLTIATASVAASGPSAGLLLTTGHEQFYLRTISIGLVARFLLICLLTPYWGALGAALGTAFVNVPMAVFLAAACRRKCNVDPSVFSIFRSTPG
jgi:O-antigen/teichoic acid export membrane protein